MTFTEPSLNIVRKFEDEILARTDDCEICRQQKQFASDGSETLRR